MLELFTKEAVFKGESEFEQLEAIYNICGTPTPETFGGVANVPIFHLISPKTKKERRRREFFASKLSESAMDLVDRLLSLDPKKRPSADEALRHDWFTEKTDGTCRPIE